MAMFTVIQEQTVNGCFNSTALKHEAVNYNHLTLSARETYLQENFHANGHGEGASNLTELAAAIREFGADNVDSYTLLCA